MDTRPMHFRIVDPQDNTVMEWQFNPDGRVVWVAPEELRLAPGTVIVIERKRSEFRHTSEGVEFRFVPGGSEDQ